ncbi:MAG: inosine/xanthosine triphosphatase [Candidatus Bipolaricaulota bacterium]
MDPVRSSHVVVASGNPVKAAAVERGFRRAFPGAALHFESLPVALGAADQPMSDEETLHGAEARAKAARANRPDADFWVGIEGGVADLEGLMAAFAWVAVDARTRRGRARTGTFFVPEAVAELVRSGLELGLADDKLFGRTDSKRDAGAVGLLTAGAIDRTTLYEQAVLLALIPFLNPELFGRTCRRSAGEENP